MTRPNTRSQLPVVYVREKVYFPADCVDRQVVADEYTLRFYNEKSCAQCDYKEDRFCHMCEVCPSYRGAVRLHNTRIIKGKSYLGLPIGDKKNFDSLFGILWEDFKVVDKRSQERFDYKIRFLLKLYPYQQKVIDAFMRKKYGLIEAPPRTGKTVIMLAIAVLLGYKMVLIADQHEFLQQFLWHIEGNEDEGIPKCTNLPELELKTGKKLYGFPKTDEDFENFQFFVMTYQQFASEEKGKQRLRRLMNRVGTVSVDEVHSAAAPVFASVLGSMWPRVMFGVTGTVDRKDGKQRVIKKVLGPVVARTKVDAMIPTVYVHETGVVVKKPPKLWVYAMKRLADSKPRNKMIVEQVVKDLKAGHSIVIPLSFKKHVKELVQQINERVGVPIAEEFVGGGTVANKNRRRQVLSDAKARKVRVVVGIRRLLQRGLNVAQWSAIYTVIPISNKPNYKQETARVCTPLEGKTPIVRLFYDASLGQSSGCARNCITHLKSFKFQFSNDPHTQECLRNLAATRKRWGEDEGDSPWDDEFKAVMADHVQPFEVEERGSGGTSLSRARAGRR